MNALTAEEIIAESNKPGNLPDTGGMKYFKHDPKCTKQIESVEAAFGTYSECLREERVCRKMNLSVAEWNQEENLGLVKVMKGSTLQKFGFQTRDGKFLYPEECMFLMEQGILEVYYDGLPISLQEAHMLLLPLLPSFEYYQVYSHLCRLGYLVNRFKKFERVLKEPSHRWERRRVNTGSMTKQDSTDSKRLHERLNSTSDRTAEQDSLHAKTDEIPDCLKSGYMKTLWRGTCVPLVRPSEATCTSAVLSKLQSSQITRLKEYEPNTGYARKRLKIDFDVYKSKETRKQSKNDLDSAQFRIVVCRYEDDPPSLEEMADLTKESGDVHLKVGVVNQGTVSFYGMFSVDLPTIITQP